MLFDLRRANIRGWMRQRKRIGKWHPPKARNGEARPPARPRAAHAGHSSGGDSNWLYGVHAGLAALGNSARRCRRLLLTDDSQRALAGKLPPLPAPEIVDRQVIEQLLPPGSVHQGLAVLADPLPNRDLADVAKPVAGQRSVIVVLDQVTDPQNVGAIMRTAAAFGARAIVTTDRHAPPQSGALAKAASGALEMIPFVRVTNLARAMEEIGELGYWRIGLASDGPSLLAAAISGDVALVLGAEGAGMRRLTAENCDVIARLPTLPAMPSLNVAAAAAAALYELAARQGHS
jgi:23S rRNA (guanosine2251-2'-O)-methyltransferase